MLVCHCLRVFDREVRACVRSGAQSVEDVSDRCGAGTRCGGCRESIGAIIEHESTRAPRLQLAVLTDDRVAA